MESIWGFAMEPLCLLIMKAVFLNHKTTRILLKAGADVEYKSERFFKTPLVMAVTYNSVGLAKLLLDHGADPNNPRPGIFTSTKLSERYPGLNPKKRSPLELCKSEQMMELLVEHGVKIKDPWGRTTKLSPEMQKAYDEAVEAWRGSDSESMETRKEFDIGKFRAMVQDKNSKGGGVNMCGY